MEYVFGAIFAILPADSRPGVEAANVLSSGWLSVVLSVGIIALLLALLMLYRRYRLSEIKFSHMREAVRNADRSRRMIVRQLHFPILLFDCGGKLIDVNPAACKLAGRSREAILATPCFDSFCREASQPVYCPVRKCLSTGERVEVDLHFGDREFRMTADPVFNADGTIEYVLESAVDMTEVNANQRELASVLRILREREREHQLILDHIKIPIFLYDAAGELVRFNTIARQIAGADEGEVARIGCNRKFCKLGNRADGCPVLRVLESGISTQTRLTISGRECLVCADPITDDAGKLINVVKSVIDITEIEEGKRKQEEALRAKSFFIGHVSHEIRTPLNAVIGFAELLRSDSAEAARRQEYLDAICDSGNALLQLVNDVLDLSLLETGRMNLELTRCNFKDLSSEIGLLFQRRLETGGVKLSWSSEPMSDLMLDRRRIRQILLSLVGNAVKFTANGQIRLEAYYEPRPETGNGTLHFSVTDTGCGISSDDCRKLFEPFAELSTYRGTCADRRGSGLGLPLCRKLLQNMGGEISVESEPGRGSCFRVTIPAAAADDAGATSVSGGGAVFAPRRVLLVDDVAMNRQVLEALLKRTGAETQSAVSGREALEWLERRQFDLILSDLWMPEMDGAVLAAAIKADPRFTALPLVAVTADVEADQHFNMKFFNTVILKPVTAAKLREALAAVTEQVTASR